MKYEQKPETGTLFKNDRKTESNHPDFKGVYKNSDGEEYWVSAWIKQGAKGEFISFATKKKDATPF